MKGDGNHQGKTPSVDINESRRGPIHPIEVFEETKDPIKNPELATPSPVGRHVIHAYVRRQFPAR